ncbi:MAG TPA: cysteine--tRNA ligase [Methylomusa anaerophila]|uniref:Cysteine--tRNA ligase n=1 Tax=Methylomusa anaerophila TaxID=1930071 RepID=A0A348AJT1_9FIRM|nr:cysteine--tRNA ligase [Methylomusa anaerophila]BBB91329.1 cysteine--tRNA ligase [Methylomusa anaerophila]HML90496.1 cysteine--tRNA ligase [Methylomusa anaerophila]
MNLRVYNTLTRQKEEFVSLEPGKIKMYVCGVTPYNHPHIGNARPFITWDAIRRYLEYKGFAVCYVQNFTDVDDKIINAANGEKVTWDVIANRYIASYFEVMDKLNIRRAHFYPRVSEHMADIINMVATLIDKGFAYEVDGDVYYSVEKFPGYGKLSGRSLEDMKAGARIDVDERKKHPMDFALWKSAKPGEPSWKSPWGAGRPGWHIECSVMSYKYLGSSFDFHGGGSDLIFPHHENEIAQSEAFTGEEPFVRYWLHNGFITVNEEKMSKSLGNFFLVKDILEHFRPEILRFFILSTHYRSPLDFSDERLQEAGRSLERLKTAQENLKHLIGMGEGQGEGQDATILSDAATGALKDFTEAMDDDFNTALAISAQFGLAREINIYHGKVAGGKVKADSQAIVAARQAFTTMADILGILAEDNSGSKDEDARLVEQLMEIIIDIRQEARKKKDWAAADSIRDRLAEIGIILEDSPQGVRWKKREV